MDNDVVLMLREEGGRYKAGVTQEEADLSARGLVMIRGQAHTVPVRLQALSKGEGVFMEPGSR